MTLPIPRAVRETRFDSYGYRIKRRRWHSKCNCEEPCQGRYNCTCKAHKGHRSTPWCCGADDDIERKHGPTCDDCAMLIRQSEGAS